MEQYPFLILLAIFPAPYLHEGSHWFVGWLGKADPEINRVFWVIPNGVHFQEMKEVDAGLLRASGFAPFIWLPVAFFATVLFLIEQSPSYFFLAAVLFYTVLMSSEADALAFRNPEAFREQALSEGLDRTPLFLPNWLLPDWLPRF